VENYIKAIKGVYSSIAIEDINIEDIGVKAIKGIYFYIINLLTLISLFYFVLFSSN
jgi:hypothetical protein